MQDINMCAQSTPDLIRRKQSISGFVDLKLPHVHGSIYRAVLFASAPIHTALLPSLFKKLNLNNDWFEALHKAVRKYALQSGSISDDQPI